MSVLIVVITKDTLTPECEKSIQAQKVDWIICGRHPKFAHDCPVHRVYLNCSDNRENARKMALASEADWFLFVDSDIILPDNTVESFLLQTKVPNAEKRILGGWYKVRNSDRWAGGRWVADNVFSHYKKPLRSVAQTHVIGLGCAFMSRKALTDLQFKHGLDRICKDIEGSDMFLGECSIFGNDANEKGYDLFLDGSIICGHPD